MDEKNPGLPTRDAAESPGRRQLMKALAAGAGAAGLAGMLPDRWVRPVVETVQVGVGAQSLGGEGVHEDPPDDPGG